MKLSIEEIIVTIKRADAIQILNVLNDSDFSKMEYSGDNKAAFQLRNLLTANFCNCKTGIHTPD